MLHIYLDIPNMRYNLKNKDLCNTNFKIATNSKCVKKEIKKF